MGPFVSSPNRSGHLDEKDYQVPLRFRGKIGKLTVKLGPNEL
jgi:hypothetical protein